MTTIYHNPRCSKSRATLELLRARGIEPEVVQYLQTPPDAAALREIIAMLGCPAAEIVRRGEPVFRETSAARTFSDEELVDLLAQHPVLLQRPIVVHAGKAAIGRPPENVLALFA